MSELFLSDDCYTALLSFAAGQTPDVSGDVFSYLFDHGLITVDCPDLEVGPGTSLDNIVEINHPPRITEYGKGFIRAMKEYETRLSELKRISASAELSASESRRSSDAAEKIAESSAKTASSAESLSRLAEKKATRADIKSIISLIFAAIALVFEFAVNHSAIVGFFKTLIP